MHRCSNASYTLCEGPSVPWVTTSKDNLDTAEHRAAAPGVRHLLILHLRLNAQMALDASDRVYRYLPCHVILLTPVSSLNLTAKKYNQA
jgi:hypothetical protein